MVNFFVIQKYRLTNHPTSEYNTGPTHMRGPYPTLENSREEAKKIMQYIASGHPDEFSQATLDLALGEIAVKRSAEMIGKTITVAFEIQEQ